MERFLALIWLVLLSSLGISSARAYLTSAQGDSSTVASVFGRVSSVTALTGDYAAFYTKRANNLSDVASLQTTRDNLMGAVTSGDYMRCDGTHCGLAAIQAGDVPTLNQNTSGNAATATLATTATTANAAKIAVQGAGVTPACAAGQNGLLALTSAYLLCVCNTSAWVKTSDGATACTF